MQSHLLASFLELTGRGIAIFGFQIYFYAIVIVTGMIVSAALAALLMKRRNMDPNFIFTLFIFCIPAAIIGARLFYCITGNVPFKEWFDVRDGGLSIIGGVIGGVGVGVAVCLIKKIDFFRAADCVVICILLGQVFGRWGNFFNQEVYGAVVTDPHLQWFPFAVYIDADAQWHYAFFFYEAFFNSIVFALLYAAAWYWKKKPNGVFTFAYFAWYGLIRTVMEPLRDPQYILSGGNVPWSLVFSIIMFVMGLAGIGILLYVNYMREGAVIGSKTGDPCGISAFLTPDKETKPYYSKINMLGANYPPKPPKGKKGEEVAPVGAEESAPEEPVENNEPEDSASPRHSERSEKSTPEENPESAEHEESKEDES